MAPRFPVVGIGASAGGLETVSELLRHLPARTGMAFVFVQHLDPTHGSMLRDLLARKSPLPVLEAEHGTSVEPDHLYVIRPNTELGIADGALRVAPRAEARGPHMPVDSFFRALARDQGRYAIGIVLSGTGSDGAQGLAAIKAEGGTTFAQEERSARHGGMPHAAVAAGGVDFVLPPHEIARELARIAGDPEALRTDRPVPSAEDEGALARIIAVLRTSTGVDLSYYKRPNLLRRIQRRRLLRQVDGLDAYVRYLQDHPAEIAALHHDILINVTSFFRDEEALEGLTATVFPAIVTNRAAAAPIRLWVPGCATGEEPYTLAIALVEFLEQTSETSGIQIFATDVSDRAIERARAGVFRESIAADVSAERLRRFFVKVEGGYQVSKPIRDLCVFAKHNLVTDPPFSQLDLISCCNVLIYLRPEYQRRVMELFHYALQPHGFLKLGRSETIGGAPELFTVRDRAHNIYAKKLVGPRMPRPFTARPNVRAGGHEAGRSTPHVAWSLADLEKAADRLVMERYAPAGVVISDDMTIVQFRGRTGAFLEPLPGDATLNLLKMARESLALDLRAAIHQARTENRPVRKEGLTAMDGDRVRRVNLEVTPLDAPTGSGRHFLVLFEDVPVPASRRYAPRRRGDASATVPVDEPEVAQLRTELADSKRHLETIIQEVEAANEELRAANEETLSGNEELQSTNEELETAKEELQSTNEELSTVNDQLQVSNLELSQTANDLSNLLSSVELAIVMVGSDLCIRRATPAASRLLHLLPADIGRPLTDLHLDLAGVSDLRGLLLEVIDSVALRQADVRDQSGRRYILRGHPYRTEEHRVEGVVMVLIDVEDLKRSVEAAEAAREAVGRILEITDAILGDLSLDALLAQLLGRLQRALQVDTAAILLREPGERDQPDVLRARAAIGLDDEVQRAIRVPIGRGFAGRIAAEKAPVVLEEIGHQELVSPWIRAKRIESLAGVPLLAEGRLIGVLHVGSLRRRRFEDEEIQLLRLAADRAALAIERATSRDAERHARETAEAANRAKDEFLAILSHELRSPLNTMLSWLEVLKRESATTEQRRRAVETLERNVWQQAHLVRDLLDVSRIISGKLAIASDLVDIAEIGRTCIQALRPAAERKGVALDSTEVDRPCVVRGDAARLEQVMENLVSNAIKFTPAGGRIDVVVERDHRQVTITVADTGVGIAPEFLPYVFDRFRQADSTTTRHYGGLGLGLALARHLVERHGGTITAQSPGSDRGSTLSVRLPLHVEDRVDDATEPPPPDGRSPELGDLSILLVDDDPDTCAGVALALQGRGARVWTAASVHQAMSIERLARPRVVISDISMPDQDGYVLIQQMRARDAERGTRTITIAMTGLAGSEDRARALAAGFDDHVAKPVDPRALIAALGRLLGGRDAARDQC